MTANNSYPEAICYDCGAKYSGWRAAQRKMCNCGGKLCFSFPYDIIIGYTKAGNNKKGVKIASVIEKDRGGGAIQNIRG